MMAEIDGERSSPTVIEQEFHGNLEYEPMLSSFYKKYQNGELSEELALKLTINILLQALRMWRNLADRREEEL